MSQKPVARFFTHSGKTVDLNRFTEADVDIVDIAHGLANTCRYNGQCERFYSVAEHCSRLSRFANNTDVKSEYHKALARAALMHDAAEAYIGDIVFHLKPLLPAFVEMEKQIEGVIFKKFGIDKDMLVCKKELHEIDRAISYDEMYELYGRVDSWFIENKVGPLGKKIMVGPNDKLGWTPEQSKAQFLLVAEFLGLYQPPVMKPEVVVKPKPVKKKGKKNDKNRSVKRPTRKR